MPISRRLWSSSRTTPRHTSTSARALASRGRIDEAIAHFQKALELKPDYAEAHNGLALALAARGRNDEAIAHHRKAASEQIAARSTEPSRTAREKAIDAIVKLGGYVALDENSPGKPAVEVDFGNGRLPVVELDRRRPMRAVRCGDQIGVSPTLGWFI